jgi:hypothetical protein
MAGAAAAASGMPPRGGQKPRFDQAASPRYSWIRPPSRSCRRTFRGLTKFVGPFDEAFRSEGTTVILTPIRAPNANAYAERVIETVRAEYLDWSLIPRSAASRSDAPHESRTRHSAAPADAYSTFCRAGRHCLANDGACWSKTSPATADCTRQRPPSTSRPGSLAHSSPHSISRSFPSAVFARLNGQLRANGPALPLAIGCGEQTAV